MIKPDEKKAVQFAKGSTEERSTGERGKVRAKI